MLINKNSLMRLRMKKIYMNNFGKYRDDFNIKKNELKKRDKLICYMKVYIVQFLVTLCIESAAMLSAFIWSILNLNLKIGIFLLNDTYKNDVKLEDTKRPEMENSCIYAF